MSEFFNSNTLVAVPVWQYVPAILYFESIGFIWTPGPCAVSYLWQLAPLPLFPTLVRHRQRNENESPLRRESGNRPQIASFSQSTDYHSAVTESVDHQWKHRVHHEHRNPIVRRLFRVPTNKVECITGKNDEWAHWIMHLTETELTLPRCTQEPIFIIIGREDDVRRALRMVEDMINGDYTSDGSHPDPLRKRDYAIVSEPNFEENGIHYTLCRHGQIDENDYLPQCSKNNTNSQKKQVSDEY